MKTIDIEALLVWAYRQELPKRDWLDVARLSETESNWAMVDKQGKLQTHKVGDGRSFGNRYAVLGGDGPHPDALAVNAAVRELDDPRLTPAIEDAEALLADMPAEVRTEAEASLDGYRVQIGALVTRCARLATRPDWRCETPERRVVLAATSGQAAWFVKREVAMASGGRMTVEQNGYDLRAKRPYADAYRKFVFEPPVRLAVAQRADYMVWCGALAWLAERLDKRLANHRATGPGVAAMPWVEGERAAPRVLPSLARDGEAA